MERCITCQLPITDDATIKAQRATCVCGQTKISNSTVKCPDDDCCGGLGEKIVNEKVLLPMKRTFLVCTGCNIEYEVVGNISGLGYWKCSCGCEEYKLKEITDGIFITAQHAFSLAELVKHYRKMIETMNKDNAPLTMEYCDELIKDLEK
jgi:hypothetical protein